VRGIELDSVSLAFEGRSILRDMELRVEPGERVALLGASGSGKTSVLRLVAGFLAPGHGRVRVGGETVAEGGRIVVPPEERGVGMVFQDLALWPHLTVQGNLAFGLRAQGIRREERAQRIAAMLEMVGLSTFTRSRPSELSGGEQQRVALARALVLRPGVLLMDEPLSSLDEVLNLQLRRKIVRLHEELGFTLVYVTHRRDEAAEIATRIARIEQGTLRWSR